MAEIYFFAWINDTFKRFGIDRDPFHFKKALQLEILNLANGHGDNKSIPLEQLIQYSLIGNSHDLSQLHSMDEQVRLLINDTGLLIKEINKTESVQIVLDNAGGELLSDTLLALHLCEKLNKRVTLHFKAEPIFVSDALVDDFWSLISGLNKVDLQTRIDNLLDKNRLVLKESTFWSSPMSFNHLHKEQVFDNQDDQLFIFKGDANYRRLFDDRQYAISDDTKHSFTFLKSPTFVIRTLKSEILLGYQGEIPPEENWLTSGRYGVIQKIS